MNTEIQSESYTLSGLTKSAPEQLQGQDEVVWVTARKTFQLRTSVPSLVDTAVRSRVIRYSGFYLVRSRRRTMRMRGIWSSHIRSERLND